MFFFFCSFKVKAHQGPPDIPKNRFCDIMDTVSEERKDREGVIIRDPLKIFRCQEGHGIPPASPFHHIKCTILQKCQEGKAQGIFIHSFQKGIMDLMTDPIHGII